MQPKPTADISQFRKAQIVVGLTEAKKDAIKSVRPYQLTKLDVLKDGTTQLDIFVDQAGNPIHRITKQLDGTVTLKTMDKLEPGRTISDQNPTMIEPLRVAMRNMLQDLAVRRFGINDVTLTTQCHHHGTQWVKELNAHAMSLCRLALGDYDFNHASERINATMQKHLINPWTNNVADHIKNFIKPAVGTDEKDVTFWQYNTTVLAGTTIMTMLLTPEQRAFAAYFWEALAIKYWRTPEPGPFPTTAEAIRQHVVDYLELNEAEADVFAKVRTLIAQNDQPKHIRTRCRALAGCGDADPYMLQHAYDMNIHQTVAEWNWPQGDAWAAWTRTLQTLLNDPQTEEQDLYKVYESFRNALEFQQPWTVGNRGHYLEVASRPHATNSNLGAIAYDGIIMACHLPELETGGFRMNALTTAQQVAEAELQTGIRLSHTWNDCRNGDTQAYIVQTSKTAIAIAIIERTAAGWQPKKTIQVPGYGMQTSVFNTTERLAVLYSAAEEHTRRAR